METHFLWLGVPRSPTTSPGVGITILTGQAEDATSGAFSCLGNRSRLSTSRTRQADPTGLLAATVEALAGKGKIKAKLEPLARSISRSFPTCSGPTTTSPSPPEQVPLAALPPPNPPGPSVKNKSPTGREGGFPRSGRLFPVDRGTGHPEKKKPNVDDPSPTTDFRSGAGPPGQESETRA